MHIVRRGVSLILTCMGCNSLSLVLLAFIGFMPVVHADLTSGLVAFYPFSGTADDVSGHMNHGIVHGAVPAADRFGIANAAYSFNGVNAYIQIPDSDSLDLTTEYTLSAWIFQKSAQSDGFRIIDKETPGVPDGFNFDTRGGDNGRRLRLCDNTVCQANSDYELNRWHHVAVTKSGQRVIFYLNGTPDGSGTVGGNLQPNVLALHIGGPHGVGLPLFFDGLLDDLRIYNRALSADEVHQLYTNGSAAAVVSNVRASQRVGTRLVDVYYNLAAAEGVFNVAVSVSTNNGISYDLPATTFSGNGVGTGVAPGQNKWVIWNAGIDWSEQYSDKVRFRVTAQR